MEPLEFSKTPALAAQVEEDLKLCIDHRRGSRIAIQQDDTGQIQTRTSSILGTIGAGIWAYVGKGSYQGEEAEKRLQEDLLGKLRQLIHSKISIEPEKIQRYEEQIKKIVDLSGEYFNIVGEDEKLKLYQGEVKIEIERANLKIQELRQARINFENILNQIKDKGLPLEKRLEKCQYLLRSSYLGGKEVYDECRVKLRDMASDLIKEVKERIVKINKELIPRLSTPQVLITELHLLEKIVINLGQIVSEADDRVIDHRDEMNEIRSFHENLMKQAQEVGLIAGRFAEGAQKKIKDAVIMNKNRQGVIEREEMELKLIMEEVHKKREEERKAIPDLLKAIARDLKLSHSISADSSDYWSGDILAIEREIQLLLASKNKADPTLKGGQAVENALDIMRLEGALKHIVRAKDLRKQHLSSEANRLLFEGQLKEKGKEKIEIGIKIAELENAQKKLDGDLKAISGSPGIAHIIHYSALLIAGSKAIMGVADFRKLSAEIAASIPSPKERESEWEIVERPVERPIVEIPEILFPEGEEAYRKFIGELESTVKTS